MVSADDDPAALAALGRADAAGARCCVVAPTDSGLARKAAAASHALVSSPVTVPVGRAATGAFVVHLLAILEQLGQHGDRESAVSAAVAQLERRRGELAVDDNPMAVLARRIGRTLPVVYGSDELAGVAAAHWKQQVNLDAKAPAFTGMLPDVGWDEVAGWGQHGDMTRQVFSLVTLRHDHEPAGAEDAMVEVVGLLDEVVHDHFAVGAEGNGPLAQVLDLVLQGDLAGWHLAQELEIDPGPTAAVSQLATVWSKP